MLFIPTRRINMPSTRRGVSRPFITAEPGEVLNLTWLTTIFATVVTLLGFSYGLIMLAEYHILASVLGITVLVLLLVWYAGPRKKMPIQVQDSSTTDRSIDFMGRYFQRVTI
jgi:hypothetical protein